MQHRRVSGGQGGERARSGRKACKDHICRVLAKSCPEAVTLCEHQNTHPNFVYFQTGAGMGFPRFFAVAPLRGCTPARGNRRAFKKDIGRRNDFLVMWKCVSSGNACATPRDAAFTPFELELLF